MSDGQAYTITAGKVGPGGAFQLRGMLVLHVQLLVPPWHLSPLLPRPLILPSLQRATGEAKYFVPRCIAGTPDADLDGANGKLLVRRYGRNHTHSK